MTSKGAIKSLIIQILAGVTFSFGDLVANSYAASKYGLSLLWTKLLASLLMIVILQISAQIGSFTGRGLIENIKLKYGVRQSMICSSIMFMVNTATVTAEVTAASLVLEFFTNISCKFWAPLMALSLCIIAIFSSSTILRMFLSLVSFLVLLIIPVAARYNSNFDEFIRGFITISMVPSKDWLLTVMALLGCVVSGYLILFEVHEGSDESNNLPNLFNKYNGIVIGAFESLVLGVSVMLICASQLYVRGEIVDSISDILCTLIPKLGGFGAILFIFGIMISFYLSCSVIVISSFKLLEELIADIAEITKIRYAILSGWKVILSSLSILLGAFLIMFNVNVIKLSLYASALSTLTLPIPLFFMAKLFSEIKFPIKTNYGLLKFICWFLVVFLSMFSFGSIILAFI
ncbi:MAG: divalent metal cation transporter [Candidatus Methanomethylicia archaeon]